MKNNKGLTITEIVISIVLVSIVLVFLINVLITIKGANERQETSSKLLINRAVILREVQKDFIDHKLIGVSKCESSDINKTGKNRIIPSGATNIYCLKLTYADNLQGYILQYTYNYSANTQKSFIGYKRGDNQFVRETSIKMNPNTVLGKVTSSCSNEISTNCSLNIYVPIIDEKDNDYGITINYIYDSNSFTYTKGSNYGFKIE